MILNYKEPQLNIDQKLATETTAIATRQSAVIVGTQYVSPGFDENFEYDDFSSTGGNLPLTFTDEDGTKTVDVDGLVYKLDVDSLDVKVRAVEYDLVEADGYTEDNGVPCSAGDAPNQIISVQNLAVAGDGLLWDELKGRPVSIGDTIYSYNETTGGDVQKRKVTGFIGKPIASSVGTDTDSEDTLFGAALANPLDTVSGGSTPTNVSVPGNYSVDAITVTSLAKAVNINGLSVSESGSIYAGVRLSLRIVSYNSDTETGAAAVTSSDGVISTTCSFTKVTDTLTFDLSDTIDLHGLTDAVFTLAEDSIDPTPGETFTFTLKVGYTALDPAAEITSGASDYIGTVDNTYYLKVTAGSHSSGSVTAQLQVYDAKGTFTPFLVSLPYGDAGITIQMGSGVEVVLDYTDIKALAQAGLRKNDIYYINAKAAKASTVEFTGLVLDGPAAISGAPAAFKVRGVATGSITTENQESGEGFELNVDGVSVDYYAALTWKVAGRDTGFEYVPLLEDSGDIYVDWRAAKVPSESEGRITISSSADLDQLGKITPNNDLAFAAYTALKASPTTVFYALRTAGDTAAEIEEALTKLENSDTSYALGIISDDTEAFSVAIAHAEAMSANNVKNFRRVYFGVDSPGEYTYMSKDENGDNLQATILNYGGAYRYVGFTSATDLTTSGVSAGDFVVMGDSKFVIEQILSDTELLITTSSAPNLPVSPAVDASIVKANTAQNQVEYVSAIAKVGANRRGILIWCDAPVGVDTAGEYFQLPVKFIAAEVAALRAATAPQLGLTRSEIVSVVECPSMYSRFKRATLNEAAANGVMIITQDHEGSAVFVRHQLTTDVSNGSLYYEDSVGMNVDNLSFKLKDVLDKYIGKRNVTPTTFGLIKHEVFRIMEDARTTTIADLEDGPQILNFYDEEGRVGKVTVKAHPTFKDRILVKVKVTIPLPLNIIEVELEAVSEVVVTA